MLNKFLSHLERVKRLISKYEIPFQFFLLIIVSSAIYLHKVGQLQYYKDDWYYVLDGLYGGPAVFNEMFAIDRPARGPLFQAYFSLFGANPLPYHLGHYFWRLSAALAALWLFRMIWPGRDRQAFFAALFFIIYPGYVWWTSGIEYQPMVVSLCLQVLSIALTIKAILSPKILGKSIFILGSILTGWGYLSLVDYAIGMEFFRLGLVFVLVNREKNLSSLRKGFQTIKVWFYTSFLIPGGFLFWKMFLFTNARKVTDLGIQLSPFIEAPRQIIKLWLVGVVRDGLNVSFLAWFEPFNQYFWNLNLNEIIIGLIFAAFLIGTVFASSHLLKEPPTKEGIFEPVVVGLIACFVGVIPIIVANRHIDFGLFSHYSLPVSLSAALFLASLIAFISPPKMQFVIVSLVVAAAALTHYTAAISVVREINIINSFWWQVYWRAPGIREGTTLIVDYPVLGFDDQMDNVWGPANLLYYPENRQLDIPVQYKLSALPLRGLELGNLFSKGKQKTSYRTHYFRYNEDQIVVLSQPIEGACVRILDGNLPIFSSNDTSEIKLLSSYSKLDNIILDSPTQTPSAVFGKQPDHDWCYYFEKVDFAIHQGDWKAALSLSEEVLAKGFAPADPVEWIPFLYTYMVHNDLEMATMIARKIKKDEALEKEVCDVFFAHYHQDLQITPEMSDRLKFLLCHE